MRQSSLRAAVPMLLCAAMLLLAACASSPPGGTQASPTVPTTKPPTNLGPDNLPYPAWWKNEHTPCDTTKVSTSAPLSPNAFYRGVPACGPINLPTDNSTLIYPAGTWGEWEWQCVELSTRFMYLAYGIKPYNANGNQVVDNYHQYNPDNPILVPVPNDGSSKTAPQPGDILSYVNTGTEFGHTSVVIASQVDSSGTGSVTVLEQNRQDDTTGITKLAVMNWIVAPTSNGTISPVEAWLHHTVDLIPQTALPKTSIQVHGEDFLPGEPVLITFDNATQVGMTTADGSGVVSTVIAIPSGAAHGSHTIKVIGQTSHFSPQTVLYVGATTYSTPTPPMPSATPIPPTPTSTPVRLQQSIYLSAQDGIYALDPNNGSQLWHYAISFPNGHPQLQVANGVVYFILDDDTAQSSTMYALNAQDGTLRKKYTLPYYAFNGFGYTPPFAVANGIIYVSGVDMAFAINSSDGSQLWHYAWNGLGASAPVVVNNLVFAVTYQADVYAFNSADGTLAWQYSLGPQAQPPGSLSGYFAPPVMLNNTLYVLGWLTNNVYAINIATHMLTWQMQLANAVVDTLFVANGTIYVDSRPNYPGPGSVYALQASTGAQLWSRQNLSLRFAGASALYCAGIDANDDFTGDFSALHFDGTDLWHAQLNGADVVSVAAGYKVIYVATDTTLYAINATDGSFLWQEPLSGYVVTP